MRLFFLLSFFSSVALAQTDSVIVSGRVNRLSARLYRQSPNVTVARTNITRGGSEQAFAAPLQPDGQFRVAVPIIYPLEEMTFQVAGAATPFLAVAGRVSIEVDNDSLFVAAVPFRFGGVNAQVNQQFAQYKATDYRQQQVGRSERDRQVRRAMNAGTLAETYSSLVNTFATPLGSFAQGRTVFPLVQDWVRANAQYDAAALVFDRAVSTGQDVPAGLLKTMLMGNDNLLTPARANALNRFATYASGQVQEQVARSGQAVKIRRLAALLDRYVPDLTAADRERLAAMRDAGSARQTDVRYLSKLMERRPDTLSKLTMYENMTQAARALFDSASADYLKAYFVTSVLPQLTLATAQLLGQHVRPQLGNARLGESFNDAVGQALRDTALVRTARTTYVTQEKRTGINYGPLGNGIFVTTGTYRAGNDLVKSALDRNRGKVIYVVLWQPTEEDSRQLAREAQPLLDAFSSRDVAVLYIGMGEATETLWLESVVRSRLRGDHLRLTPEQAEDAISVLNLYEPSPVRLITPQGKLHRREALLPGGGAAEDFDKLVAQIQELLR